MLDIIALGIHAIQFLFAIIVLGLTGHIASVTDGYTPSRDAFELFTAVWTIVILVYLALAPRFFQQVAHPFVIFGLNFLTMLFWFAAFIAMAVFHHDLEQVDIITIDYIYNACAAIGSYCPTVEAAAIFGAFEWALFVATTVLAALAAFRGTRTKSSPGNMSGTTAA